MVHKFDASKVIRDSKGKSWLCLRIQNAPMARNECSQLKPGLYDAEIKKHRDKRSGEANRYAWALMGKLAAVTGIHKDMIYREYVRGIGDNFEVFHVPDDAARAELSKLWDSRGLGWLVDDLGNGDIVCYYGSSTYDTAQMSRFIDLIVQDCREQGIQTETPEELARMVEDWKCDEKRK